MAYSQKSQVLDDLISQRPAPITTTLALARSSWSHQLIKRNRAKRSRSPWTSPLNRITSLNAVVLPTGPDCALLPEDSSRIRFEPGQRFVTATITMTTIMNALNTVPKLPTIKPNHALPRPMS